VIGLGDIRAPMAPIAYTKAAEQYLL